MVAIWEEYHWIGEITSVNWESPDFVQINFMHPSNVKLHRFKWPQKKDELPVHKDDIGCTIDNPVPFSKRVFTARLPSGLNLGSL